MSGSPIRKPTTLHELESWEDRHGAKYARLFYYCVDAEIVVLGNVDPRQGLVTGARAKIVELLGPTAFIVKLMNPPTHMGSCFVTLHKQKRRMNLGKNTIERFQFPAVLAFCLTFHRFQGQTILSPARVHLTRIWEHGQLYVTVSRFARLEDMHYLSLDVDLLNKGGIFSCFKCCPAEFNVKLKQKKLSEMRARSQRWCEIYLQQATLTAVERNILRSELNSFLALQSTAEQDAILDSAVLVKRLHSNPLVARYLADVQQRRERHLILQDIEESRYVKNEMVVRVLTYMKYGKQRLLLRNMGEPYRLFGESEVQARTRHETITSPIVQDIANEIACGGSVTVMHVGAHLPLLGVAQTSSILERVRQMDAWTLQNEDMQHIIQLLIEKTTIDHTLPLHGQCHVVGSQLHWGAAYGVGGPPYATANSVIGPKPRSVPQLHVLLPPAVVQDDEDLFDLRPGKARTVARKKARAMREGITFDKMEVDTTDDEESKSQPSDSDVSGVDENVRACGERTDSAGSASGEWDNALNADDADVYYEISKDGTTPVLRFE